MIGLFICGIMSLSGFSGDGRGQAPGPKDGPVWLKDYAPARATALRENKPIFVVFR